MKLLFITPQVPFPAQQGTTIRNFNLIRHLAKHNTVDLISFQNQDEPLLPTNPLYHFCRRFEVVVQPLRTTAARLKDSFLSPLPDMGHRLESPEMRELIERWVGSAKPDEWDIVQIEGIEVAQYGHQFVQGMRGRFGHQSTSVPKLVFDNHNCEYLLQKRNAFNDLQMPRRWVGGLYSVIQWQKLWRYEKAVCQWADATVAVSHADQQALQNLVETAHIAVVPNGLEVDELPAFPAQNTQPLSDEPLSILFIGKMDYRPNVDAILWFGHSILPLIKERFPTAVLTVVGMNPHPRLEPLRKDPAINIVGKVDDLSPYLADALLYVIPLRVGGGTRFKALEAMAHAKAIVTTSLGIEGVPAVDQIHVIVADTPNHFAHAVIHLLEDKIEAGGNWGQTLGISARAMVLEKFSWDSIIPTLETLYHQLLRE